MIECNSADKPGRQVRRRRVTVDLHAALMELNASYDECGGAGPQALAVLDAALERVLEPRVSGQAAAGRESAVDRMQRLLRARDLHLFACSDPHLVGVRMGFFERLLGHQDIEACWASVRELLLDNMHLLCPGAESVGGVERFKEAASRTDSPLGSLLAAAALFNMDRQAEQPPPNMVLRLHKGRFPEHRWELCAQGRTVGHSAAGAWRPAHPLCRWEYLASDLTHAFLRRRTRTTPYRMGGSQAAADARTDRAQRSAGGAAGGGRAGEASAESRLYFRLEADPEQAGAQMELFPLEPEVFRTELQRMVHRRLGAEGVRLLMLLVRELEGAPDGSGDRNFGGAMDGDTAAAPQTLELGRIAARHAPLGDTPRSLRARQARLERLVALLEGVELTRLHGADESSRAASADSTARAGSLGGDSEDGAVVTRLLSVLARKASRKSQHAPQDGASDAPPAERLRVVADTCLWERHGGSAPADAYLGLPQALLEARAAEHPYLIGLGAWLGAQWGDSSSGGGGDNSAVRAGKYSSGAETAEQDTAPVLRRSAGALLHEAGLWIGRSGRYRALQTLKRDLDQLRELGLLGQWRMERRSGGEAMDDVYCLQPLSTAAARGGVDGSARARTVTTVSGGPLERQRWAVDEG